MITELFSRFAAQCDLTTSQLLFGLPTWHKYLTKTQVTEPSGVTTCQPVLGSLTDVWLIVAAVIDIGLRLVTLLAIGYVVWGGIQYIKSQGRAEDLAKARGTIIYALVGMTLAIVATTLVTFIAGQFKASP